MNKPLSKSPVRDTLVRLRATFDTGHTRRASWRRDQLSRIETMLNEREAEFAAALKSDLGKSEAESYVTEIEFLRKECRHSRRRLARWMRPKRVASPMMVMPGRSRVVPEPFGVALIIAPWNYPLMLALSPLVGAIAAGNCAVVKPSEIAPATSAAIAKYVPEYLDREAIAVIEGAAEVATALLAERWDTIFYTGNSHIGRVVMSAAAEHLTPVTLELGGKSPCIVLADADLKVAAKRIAWGKYLNAGQTCVAPDYVLVEKSAEKDLIEGLGKAIESFYGTDPKASPDYGRIVNDRHFKRVSAMLKGATVAAGGETDAEARYIAPTVLSDVKPDAPVMQEEIFGPVLPVIAVDGLNEAIEFAKARPKPLSLYLFSKSRDAAKRVVDETSAGGVGINETVLHLAVPGLPFGGVGESGLGAYHGEYSFEAFSHKKSVLARPMLPDPSFRFPPVTKGRFRLLKWFT